MALLEDGRELLRAPVLSPAPPARLSQETAHKLGVAFQPPPAPSSSRVYATGGHRGTAEWFWANQPDIARQMGLPKPAGMPEADTTLGVQGFSINPVKMAVSGAVENLAERSAGGRTTLSQGQKVGALVSSLLPGGKTPLEALDDLKSGPGDILAQPKPANPFASDVGAQIGRGAAGLLTFAVGVSGGLSEPVVDVGKGFLGFFNEAPKQEPIRAPQVDIADRKAEFVDRVMLGGQPESLRDRARSAVAVGKGSAKGAAEASVESAGGPGEYNPFRGAGEASQDLEKHADGQQGKRDDVGLPHVPVLGDLPLEPSAGRAHDAVALDHVMPVPRTMGAVPSLPSFSVSEVPNMDSTFGGLKDAVMGAAAVARERPVATAAVLGGPLMLAGIVGAGVAASSRRKSGRKKKAKASKKRPSSSRRSSRKRMRRASPKKAKGEDKRGIKRGRGLGSREKDHSKKGKKLVQFKDKKTGKMVRFYRKV